MGLQIERKRLSFKAVAVVAGTNIEEEVVGLVTQDKAICTIEFCEFLRRAWLAPHAFAQQARARSGAWMA